jgi:hypothetical protein
MRLVQCLAVLALGSAVLTAAEGQDAERGQRIRVTTSDGERWVGLLEERTPEALIVRLDFEDGGASRTFALTEVKGLETGRAQTRCQAAWSKGKWWALIGAAAGTTLAFQHEQVGEDGATAGEAAALGAWSGGLFGGLIGAAVGALNPGEKWVQVQTAFHTGRDAGFSVDFVITF